MGRNESDGAGKGGLNRERKKKRSGDGDKEGGDKCDVSTRAVEMETETKRRQI